MSLERISDRYLAAGYLVASLITAASASLYERCWQSTGTGVRTYREELSLSGNLTFAVGTLLALAISITVVVRVVRGGDTGVRRWLKALAVIAFGAVAWLIAAVVVGVAGMSCAGLLD